MKAKMENPARGLEPERIMGTINSSAEFTFLILEQTLLSVKEDHAKCLQVVVPFCRERLTRPSNHPLP